MLFVLSFFAFFLLANGLVVPEKRSSGYFSLPFNVHRNSPKMIGKRDSIPVSIKNNYIQYLADIYLGSDAQHLSVVIDTGSSDLWVPLNNILCHLTNGSCTSHGSFNPSKSTSFKPLDDVDFDMVYGDYSSVDGYFATDKFSFSSSGSPSVPDLQFALATSASVNIGILGIGKKDGEVIDEYYNNLPIVLTNQSLISKPAYSIYLDSRNATLGTVLFGGIDYAKIEPPFINLPMEEEDLMVNIETLDFNGTTYDLNSSYLLDSGTAFTFLQDDVLVPIIKALNATTDKDPYGDNYYQIDCDVVEPDWEFKFNFNGVSVSVPFDDIINHDFKPSPTKCALGLYPGDIYYVLGDNFLRHAYVYYDLSNDTISIGQAKYTDDTNIVTV